MSDYQDSNRGAIPPMKDAGQYTPQYLAATGATESSNSRAFTRDRMHVLTVGATPIRVLFGAVPGTTGDIGATEGALLNAGSFFTFRAGLKSAYVYIEAADGSTAYTASVWQRES
jgi:hypothetical protein